MRDRFPAGSCLLRLLFAALVPVYGWIPVAVCAQSYPAKPVRLVSPYPPGSSADFTSRLFAPRLSELLGQQFIVDNRPGAAGNIGAELVARAVPDGYTLLTAPAALATSASLYKTLTFNLVRDFEPISLLAGAVHVLAVRPALPAKNVKELIALAKARPGHFTYASGGVGGANHLTMELFRISAGINLVHVPYKGAGAAVIDVIGGQVDMLLSSTIALLPHVKAGRLRALGITSAQRITMAPDLPTISESGLPGFESETWSALLGPARMPNAIVRRLNDAVIKIAGMPDTVDRLAAQGAVPRAGTPDQARTLIATELAKWAKVVATSGIKAE